MSNVNDGFVPYAHAEKEFSDKAGPLLTASIRKSSSATASTYPKYG
jgi:hypothetical protein